MLTRVDHQTRGEEAYFPERYLAEFLHREGQPDAVYCIEKAGVAPVHEAYEYLARELGIDAIVLVDGGTDLLMRGDEAGLGTPAEDATSLAAVAELDVRHKLASCLGFGIDAFHGVCHAHFLENVAALEQQGAFLGMHSLHLTMPEVAFYREAVRFSHECMHERRSIVNGSIVAALEGRFGDLPELVRSHQKPLFINPLMSAYWHFDLAAVARQSLYLDSLRGTHTMFEVQARIEAFRHGATIRPRTMIPV